jgi:transposase-like protein
MRYPKEIKEAILKKMMPPNKPSIADLAKAEGVSAGTLCDWRDEARKQGILLPDGNSSHEGWTTGNKFAPVDDPYEIQPGIWVCPPDDLSR